MENDRWDQQPHDQHGDKPPSSVIRGHFLGSSNSQSSRLSSPKQRTPLTPPGPSQISHSLARQPPLKKAQPRPPQGVATSTMSMVSFCLTELPGSDGVLETHTAQGLCLSAYPNQQPVCQRKQWEQHLPSTCTRLRPGWVRYIGACSPSCRVLLQYASCMSSGSL